MRLAVHSINYNKALIKNLLSNKQVRKKVETPCLKHECCKKICFYGF